MNDRGYAFVELPPDVRRRHRPSATFARRIPGTLSGTLECVLTAEQPVHIGSGFKRLVDDGTPVRECARVGGGPGIPGSTLRGVLRARFEAITRSCAGPLPDPQKKRRPADRLSQKHPKVERAWIAVSHPALSPERCQHLNQLCPACALFGSTILRSRVSVRDGQSSDGGSPVVEEMPAQFHPRLQHLGSYQLLREETLIKVSRLFGRKFSHGVAPRPKAPPQKVEVISPHSRLVAKIHFLNLEAAELGGLLTALGWEPESRLKVGAGKGHGFGRMRVHRVSITPAGTEGTEAFDRNSWRRAFENSEDRWERGEDQLIRLHQGAC